MTARRTVLSSRTITANFAAALAEAQLRVTLAEPSAISADQTFMGWLAAISKDGVNPNTGALEKGLRVDGLPFTLDDRPAMRWIYEQMPSTLEEAREKTIVLMKCAQVGFTTLEMLYALFVALKFEPLKIGFFLPDQRLAKGKSADRFLPIVRSVPAALKKLTAPRANASSARRSEGNVMTRHLGDSVLHFLWTSGKVTTESYPMDIVCFDEVQEMLIADMEKANERLSASKVKLRLMGSTANWPDADIDHWYKLGSQHRFYTECPVCGLAEPLDENFPDCIGFDPDHVDKRSGLFGAYRYVCRNGHWIENPQHGYWKAENPEAEARGMISIHFHQMLSPTITAREIHDAYAVADDMKNFFNRKLGKPYQDPSLIPVSLAHLNACAAEGVARGLTWRANASQTYMGVDQMGNFNVAVIKERLPDGKQAVVHVEFIYSRRPFDRCRELMRNYGVQVCVVESNPNFNDAHLFAQDYPRRVFLCEYGDLEGEIIKWLDGPALNASERRTIESERSRYTVKVDQYKAMQGSLSRIVETKCLFPDPQGLVQEIRENGVRRQVAILKDVVFQHFQRVALVSERINEAERRFRRKVVKVAIDPHAAYANMLCDVAWSRAHGTATFLLPEPAPVYPTAPIDHPVMQLIQRPIAEGTCGACSHFSRKPGTPGENGVGACAFRSTPAGECTVRDRDPENDCPGFSPTT